LLLRKWYLHLIFTVTFVSNMHNNNNNMEICNAHNVGARLYATRRSVLYGERYLKGKTITNYLQLLQSGYRVTGVQTECHGTCLSEQFNSAILHLRWVTAKLHCFTESVSK